MTWLIHVCVTYAWMYDSVMCVWLIHVCMTQSCVYEWFTRDMTDSRVVWLIHVWYDLWQHSFTCEGLITCFFVCHMIGMSEWDQSFDLWVVYICSISYIHIFHLIYIRATFIYKRVPPHIYTCSISNIYSRFISYTYVSQFIYIHVPSHI